MNNKCQCNGKGVLKPEMESLYDKETELPFVNHKPNKCKCINNLKLYLRGGKKIFLCSNCNLRGDVEVENENEI